MTTEEQDYGREEAVMLSGPLRGRIVILENRVLTDIAILTPEEEAALDECLAVAKRVVHRAEEVSAATDSLLAAVRDAKRENHDLMGTIKRSDQDVSNDRNQSGSSKRKARQSRKGISKSQRGAESQSQRVAA